MKIKVDLTYYEKLQLKIIGGTILFFLVPFLIGWSVTGSAVQGLLLGLAALVYLGILPIAVRDAIMRPTPRCLMLAIARFFC